MIFDIKYQDGKWEVYRNDRLIGVIRVVSGFQYYPNHIMTCGDLFPTLGDCIESVRNQNE